MHQLQTWFRLFFVPSTATFEHERQQTTTPLTDAMTWLVGITAFSFFINLLASIIYRVLFGESRFAAFVELLNDPAAPSLIRVFASPMGLYRLEVMLVMGVLVYTPLAILFNAGCFYLVSKGVARQSSATFGEHLYFYTGIRVAPTVINGLFLLTPIYGTCIQWIIRLYSIIPLYFAIKVPHKMGDGQTLIVLLLTYILVMLIMCWCIGSLVMLSMGVSGP